MNQNQHTFRILIERDDRPEPLDAGLVTFHGEDLLGFTAADARTALVADGRLKLGPDVVTFGDTIVPLVKVDRVRVELVAVSRPPTEEEIAAFKATQAAG